MTDVAPPVESKAGDVVNVPIMRDPDFRVIWADNMLVSHVPMSTELVAIELSALTTESMFISQEITVLEAKPGAQLAGSPGPVTGMAQQYHKGGLRFLPGTALNVAHAVLVHIKANELASGPAWEAAKAKFLEVLSD